MVLGLIVPDRNIVSGNRTLVMVKYLKENLVEFNMIMFTIEFIWLYYLTY